MSGLLQPLLENAHILLRPLEAADFDTLYAIAADPLLWEQHPAHDRWQQPVFERFFADAIASGGALVAIEPGTGAMVGSSRYDTGRVLPGEVEIGWTFIARSHWGSMVNRNMKALMLGHALRHFERVVLLVGEHNIRSRRAVEKIGGVLTERRHVIEMAGKQMNHVIYAIDRPGFAAGPLPRWLE